jgi:dTDP-glucose pyrophosphorylase
MIKLHLNKINVVILAGGKGTRIKKVAAGEPKALVRISGVPALILIMRRLVKQGFRKFTLVVNRENKKQIETVVKNAFNGIGIDLKTVIQPRPKGPAHAFFYGLKKVDLNSETLLCLSDTLFDEDLPVGFDWVGTSLAEGVGKWCWVEQKNDKVVQFFDKIVPPARVKNVLIGLYYFKHTKFVYNQLKKIIKSKIKSAEDEFQLSQILDLYKDKYKIESFMVDSWVDCGTEKNYLNAQKKYTNHRYFNSIILRNINGFKRVIKKGKSEKIKNEIDWFRMLAKQNKKIVPYIRRNGTNSYQMRFISDPLLSSLYLYNPGSTEDFVRIIQRLYFFCVKNLWRDKNNYRGIDTERDCQSMYEQKPFKRLADWRFWRELKSCNLIKINGINYNKPYDLLIRAIKSPEFKKHVPIKGLIHGDFHFGNIFYSKEKQSFVFIDPRGSFGNSNGFVGDIYYDISKLRHSYHGMYDAIVDGLYTLEKKTKYDFIFKVGPSRKQIIKKIDQFVSDLGFDINAVKSIELGILLSLISLHKESPKNQTAFFLQGLILAKELVKK